MMDWLRGIAGQARLPEELESKNTLERLPLGHGGYTVPWGMWVDADRRCWLHPKYTIYGSTPGGTSRMRVDHTEDGYVVDVSLCRDESWEPQEFPGYVSPVDTQYIPVAAIRGLK